MKRNLLTIFAAALALVACSQKQDYAVEADVTPESFNATVEGYGADTRTVMLTDQVIWENNDAISVFTGSDANKRYVIAEGAGTPLARFTRADNDFYTAQYAFNANYAVYPYDAQTQLLENGKIIFQAPRVQTWNNNSFAPGAFPMIAVTENRNDQDLYFRNLFGAVVVRLTGTAWIHEVRLQGNNNEFLWGQVAVTCPATRNGEPQCEVTMGNKVVTLRTKIALGVQLNPETPLEFWIAIPPTEFTKGFTVTVIDNNGRHMVKSTSQPVSVGRNVVQPMEPFEYVPEGVSFEDPEFAAFCLEQYDSDGDGIFSDEELTSVGQITVPWYVESVVGIEHFPNLYYIVANGYVEDLGDGNTEQHGYLTGIDASNNPKLERIIVQNHPAFLTLTAPNLPELNYVGCVGCRNLTQINLNGCTALERLYCYDDVNLTTLNLDNTPNLSLVSAARSGFSDFTASPGVRHLWLNNNPLLSVDLSQATNLYQLEMRGYVGHTVDLSHNTELAFLDISGSNLIALDVSANTRLYSISIEDTAVDVLDLRNNIWLDGLNIYGAPIRELTLACQPSAFTYHSLDGVNLTYIYPTSAPEQVDLGLPSGVKWATCNLGATVPYHVGYFYSWGNGAVVTPNYNLPELKNYSKYILEEGYASPIDGLRQLEAADDPATVVLGSGWRTPTEADMRELIANCTWTWTEQGEPSPSGHLNRFYEEGFLVTSNTNGNSIFIPANGAYLNNRQDVGEAFYLWTATLTTTTPRAWACAGIDGAGAGMYQLTRWYGLGIRPVHD